MGFWKKKRKARHSKSNDRFEWVIIIGDIILLPFEILFSIFKD